mgnify:FL=1
MAYDENIPNLLNLIGDDIPDIKENFQELESSGGADVVVVDDTNLSFTAEKLQAALEALNEADNINFDDTNFFTAASTVQAALLALSPMAEEHNLNDDNPSNGYYVRWPNGLQVCISPVYTVDINNSSGNIYQSDFFRWDFPASFIGLNYFAKAEVSSSINAWGSNNTVTADYCQYIGYSYESRTSDEIKVFAIGRWKL